MNKIQSKNQAGITLLLSVLLLSAITTIAFSLAAVGFAEITTSNDLVRTEPVLYHSLGVAEEAAFGMKRGVSSVQDNLGEECDNEFVSYTIEASSTFSTKTKVCNISSETSIEVAVPQNNINTAVRLYAYNPNNLYDPVTNELGDSGYETLTFKKTSDNGGFVYLYTCPLDVECVDPDINVGWDVFARPLAYNVEEEVIVNDGAFEIVLLNESGPKEYVEVVSDPIGLPYLNKEAIEIQSEFGRLIRRLRVLVPTQ